MAFGSLDDNEDVMSEINMTPLVDVMLVLLIIFIITVPVINHAVKMDLPRAANQPQEVKPENIALSIDASGQRFWQGEKIDETVLDERLKAAAEKKPQPELHLTADRNVRYEVVAQTMAAAQRNGLERIGFVTDPKAQ
ncbi:ExbD/TolR family protein [Jeongeupia naejangsanensis]|uniref:Biopolymer transporter ExbD n=1 Tax=Jeongeupia naejangsanensis TaxID=613195 RepID=A0ABS2BPD4_9NEIS|nr:biopolymer transporter ExbD [Jeongeupia naejangsanensis]MBM3117482.1 biopolymer transporter ExbD [Jeongeupia naejangsanensis]